VILGEDSPLYVTFQERYVPDLLPHRNHLPHYIFPFLALGYDPDPMLVEREVKRIGWRYPADVSGVGSNCSTHHLHVYLIEKLLFTQVA